jgi:GTP-binding protein
VICVYVQRPGDLAVNICRLKALTNMRSANKGISVGVQGLIDLSLDECIEYIGPDEVAEVTPASVRLAKKIVPKKRV